MKYFIDFEATQFSQEIISIGCYREDGEMFYSLVAPHSKNKVTNFITELTGITKEMLANAPTSDEVFCKFSDWVLENDNNPEFYVWGDSDSDFLMHTFNKTSSLKARMIISYMASALIDYSKKFEQKYYLSSTGLIKIVNCFTSDIIQTHNALDDAILLYYVYDYDKTNYEEDVIYRLSFLPTINKNMNNWKKKIKKPASHPTTKTEEIISQPNSEYAVNDTRKWSKCGYPKNSICVITSKNSSAKYVFPDVEIAAKYMYEYVFTDNQKKGMTVNSVRKHIKQAYGNSNKYMNYLWRRVV